MDMLENLLREALTHELNHKRGKGTINRLAEIRTICSSMYTNPDNWAATRTIALVHLETGETLGLFQEYQHKKTTARKLERIASDNTADCNTEFVSGPQWIQPYIHKVDPPTEGELAHIRAKWVPKMWKPAWKHLKHSTQSVESMLEELHAPT